MTSLATLCDWLSVSADERILADDPILDDTRYCTGVGSVARGICAFFTKHRTGLTIRYIPGLYPSCLHEMHELRI